MPKRNSMDEFNPYPPLSNSTKKYIVLKNKIENNVFWTSGGEYRSDWYELIFESDDLDDVKDFYMKLKYDTPFSK